MPIRSTCYFLNPQPVSTFGIVNPIFLLQAIYSLFSCPVATLLKLQGRINNKMMMMIAYNNFYLPILRSRHCYKHFIFIIKSPTGGKYSHFLQIAGVT